MEIQSIGRAIAEGRTPDHLANATPHEVWSALAEYRRALNGAWRAATHPELRGIELAKHIDAALVLVEYKAYVLLGVTEGREDSASVREDALQAARDFYFDLQVLHPRHWHAKIFRASLARVGMSKLPPPWRTLLLVP